MRVDVWSDLVCPWCYLGKIRLDRALAAFGHAVEVVHHSFQLDPTTPRPPRQRVVEHLGEKYGGGEAAGREMVQRVTDLAAEEGIAFRLAEAPAANTFDAHRLLHLALAEGGPARQGALVEALFAAYFQHAEDPSDSDVLTRVAVGAGLAADRVAEVLASEEFAPDVGADQAAARELGVGGVPFYVVAGRYGLSGAQPTEVFAQVLERAWSESGSGTPPDSDRTPSARR